MAEPTQGKTELALSPNESTELAQEVERIHALPKEAGILLLVVGLGGILLPGPVGTPFFIMGGVVLYPKLFRKAESLLERKFPSTYRHTVRQVGRFVNDLEHRYPRASTARPAE